MLKPFQPVLNIEYPCTNNKARCLFSLLLSLFPELSNYILTAAIILYFSSLSWFYTNGDEYDEPHWGEPCGIGMADLLVFYSILKKPTQVFFVLITFFDSLAQIIYFFTDV